MLSSYNPAYLRQMKREWKPEDDREEIEEEAKLIKDEKGEMLLTMNSKEGTQSFQRGRQMQRYETNERDKSRNRSTSRFNSGSKCYNCNKFGHWAKDCRGSKYCTNHNSTSHNTKDCLWNKNQSPSGRGYHRGRNGRRGNYGRGYPRRGFSGRGRGARGNQNQHYTEENTQEAASSLNYDEEFQEDFLDVASMFQT